MRWCDLRFAGDTIKPMGDFKPHPGSFLPLLEFSQRREIKSAPRSPLTLLEILAQQEQESLPLFDLQAMGHMEPSRYAEALKSLRDAGYIVFVGEGPEQVVRLTSSGTAVVRLARPA